MATSCTPPLQRLWGHQLRRCAGQPLAHYRYDPAAYFSDANEFETVCSRDGLVAFLQEAEYDYILVDWTDEYFCEEFSSLFDAPIPLGTTHDPLLFKIEDGGARMTLVAGGDEA